MSVRNRARTWPWQALLLDKLRVSGAVHLRAGEAESAFDMSEVSLCSRLECAFLVWRQRVRLRIQGLVPVTAAAWCGRVQVFSRLAWIGSGMKVQG